MAAACTEYAAQPEVCKREGDNMELDQALELAVVSSWDDLVHAGESCSIHIEYTNMTRLPVNSLEVWSIKNRGYGTLVCRCSISASNSSPSPAEPSRCIFSNSYGSKALAADLDFIIRNQYQFSRPGDHSIHGLVQVDPPSEDDRKRASAWNRSPSAESARALVA